MEEQNVFFNPGDLVKLKKEVPNSPIMMVVKKETSVFKHDRKQTDKKPILIGIRCRWFTTNGIIQEAVFNTKDIELI